MNTIINIRPYTAWNLLDYFIAHLGTEREEICKGRINDDPFYNALVDLVCKENIRELPSHLNITKPFYPYILLSYYVLLHKGNLDLAKAIYKRLLNIYADNPSIFDRHENTSLKIIEEVIEFFDTLRELDKNNHKNILKYHLEFLVAKLNKVDCTEGGWSCFFKELIIAGLEPNFEKGYEKLSSIKKNYEVKPALIDEELIEGYNLFMDEEFSPISMFLSGIAEIELDSLEHLRREISELEKKKEDVENRLEKIQKIQRKFHIYTGKAESILEKVLAYLPIIGGLIAGGIAVLFGIRLLELVFAVVIPLLISLISVLKLFEWSVRRNLKKIEEKINDLKSSKVKRLAEIIWPSQKPHNITNPT